MRVEHIELVAKRYAAQFAVDEHLLFGIDVAVQPEAFLGAFAIQFRTQLLTDELPPERFTARQHVTFEVPASTWQAWKQRHGRRWYARWITERWPARYAPDPEGRGADAVCTIELARYRTYPQARVALPAQQFGPVVYRHVIHGPWWGDDRREDHLG